VLIRVRAQVLVQVQVQVPDLAVLVSH